MSDYLIAIPSYKRPDTLKNKTLKILMNNKINPKKIHIFVSDNLQKKSYENSLDKIRMEKLLLGNQV